MRLFRVDFVENSDLDYTIKSRVFEICITNCSEETVINIPSEEILC